jgi:preprotein translocase subunit SecF
MALVPLMNLSINETLSRTINTVLTVVLVLATILALGGEVLHGFSFTMLVGIITGTYSSIYIASAFVVWYTERIKKEPVESAPTRQPKILRALKEA